MKEKKIRAIHLCLSNEIEYDHSYLGYITFFRTNHGPRISTQTDVTTRNLYRALEAQRLFLAQLAKERGMK